MRMQRVSAVYRSVEFGGIGSPRQPGSSVRRVDPFAWLHAGIRIIDRLLSRLNGIIEYGATDECLFRISRTTIAVPVLRRDGSIEVAPGAPILDLHLSNSRLPRASAHGPDLVWGAVFRRRMRRSLHELFLYVETHPELADIRAVRARCSIATSRNRHKMERILASFGLTRAEDEASASRSRVYPLLNSIWLWGLVWTFNPGCLRGRRLLRSSDDYWMSWSMLVERFGDPTQEGLQVAGGMSGEAILDDGRHLGRPSLRNKDRAEQPSDVREDVVVVLRRRADRKRANQLTLALPGKGTP